jgi:hypothetical protein
MAAIDWDTIVLAKARLLRRTLWQPDNCWSFSGAKNAGGYGVIRVARTTQLAHRMSYRLFVGELIAGLQLDHLCRNRSCVNPLHLEQVSNRTNTRRGAAGDHRKQQTALQTHCQRGHEFTTENTYLSPSHPTWRQCRRCWVLRRQIKSEVSS